MSFWENLGETISVKGKEVADKAKNISDIASLKGQIITCENAITKNYKDMGRAYFEAHKEDENAEFADQIKAIRNAEKAILELEKKINSIKGAKKCTACGEIIPADSIYCPKCGSKIEDEFFDEDGDTTELKNIIEEEDMIDE